MRTAPNSGLNHFPKLALAAYRRLFRYARRKGSAVCAGYLCGRLVVLALFLVSACIPLKGSVSSMNFQNISVPGEPLQVGDGIAILGLAVSNDDLASCVERAVADASRTIRLVPAGQLRAAAGGALASANASLTEEEIGRVLREAAASPAAAQLAVRYVFTVDGATAETDYHESPPRTGYAGVASHSQSTDILVAIWNATTGKKLGTLRAVASGRPSMAMIGLIVFWAYTPTESTACKDMAGQIVRYLLGESPATSLTIPTAIGVLTDPVT